MSDTPLLKQILLACSHGATRLFRNNNGRGWVGKSIHHPDGTVVIKHARPLHAGLQTGSGDLIGWTTIVVTPEMVGRRIAVFTSLEAKAGRDTLDDDQEQWLSQVNAAGGIAAEVRSSAEAVAALKNPLHTPACTPELPQFF